MIYSGPHIYVCNPLYKNPHEDFGGKADYDTVDLSSISDVFQTRTNFIPLLPLEEYKKLINGFCIGQDKKGGTIYDSWLMHYKMAFRNMLSQAGERTLTGCILAPGASHVHTVVSVAFKNISHLVEFAGISSSLILDFMTKTIAASNLSVSRLESTPINIDDCFKVSLFIRTLMLNSLTKHYADLWEKCWRDEYAEEQWSITDKRLKPFSELKSTWEWSTPLRNYFERRQALVEIDVIAAMALGLSLEDLEMIYNIQFPVLQQNENDTWYDAEGKIVFTCSKGLTGVGLDRPAWNAMRGEEITNENDVVMGYKGAESTYLHTIDPAKSELYGGQQQTFVAPYTKCDRIEDYRTAWAHFEKIFNK